MPIYEDLAGAAAAIRDRAKGFHPRVGLILGSGLGSFADQFDDAMAIPYGDLPLFPRSSVAGHAGQLVLGRVAGQSVAAMQGRVHFYEGFSPAEVVFPVRVLCALGIRSLVVTNAAGGIRGDLLAGDLMAITDHINLSGWNPLVGSNDERLGPRFPDMSAAYDESLTAKLGQSAAACGVNLKKGVYAILSGPSYETPAEIRALRVLGADAVGMSTVPEVLAARHMGVRVVGLSCITNLAAGVGDRPLTHEDVAATAARASGAFSLLLRHFLPFSAQ
jgi:purine-nucleoside phosphorylase